jgi:hypothetical protein
MDGKLRMQDRSHVRSPRFCSGKSLFHGNFSGTGIAPGPVTGFLIRKLTGRSNQRIDVIEGSKWAIKK